MDSAALLAALARPRDAVFDDGAALAAAATLETTARYVALHLEDRRELLAEFDRHSPESIWALLAELWALLATSFNPSPEAATRAACHASIDSRTALALAAAKFERNIVAGSFDAQVSALPHEPNVRQLIFNVTTFARIEDEHFFTLQAVLTQLLANLVSPTGDAGSKQLADTQLALYLSGGRESDVIIRLLDSRDLKTNQATLHLLNNLTQDPARLESLLAPSGVRWLAQVLGQMDAWLEADDGRFELAAGVFARLIAAGLQGRLWDALGVADEAVTPNQTVFLKLVDSALDDGAAHSNDAPSPFAFVLRGWRTAAAYALGSMKSAADDPRLPNVLVALVLASESLSAIGLAAQGRADARAPEPGGGDEALVAEMKGAGAAGAGSSIIPALVALLREMHTFLPRVKPLRPEDAPEATAAALPFANVKRDLVRLLGVLAFGDVRVGDAVRAAGGVELVLGLCETDERNPYLREHALFCVRNLMTGNPANQAIIAQMEPLGLVGEDGELKPLPEKMRKGAQATA